jgi:hypothetical protein
LEAHDMKRILAGFATAGILAAGGVAAAGALGPVADDVPAAETGARPTGHLGRHPHALRGALDAVAEVIGIDRDELVAALRDGSSVADVADAHGVDRDAVVAAIVESTNERLDAWQEDVLPGLAERFVERTPGDGSERRADGLGRRGALRHRGALHGR